MLQISNKFLVRFKNVSKFNFATNYHFNLNKNNRFLEVIDQDSKKFNLHPHWLRERSQSASYVVPSLGQALSDSSIRTNIITSYSVEGNKLKVCFSDENESYFDINVILEDARDNSRTTQFNYKKQLPKSVLWKGSEITFPTFDFFEIKKNEKSLLKLLDSLLKYGISCVKNVETTKEGVFKLTDLLGHLKTSSFGDSFLVKENELLDKVDDDTAYKNIKLMPHTDLPFVEDPPGWQLLHCLDNKCKGKGLGIYLDGFEAAEHLRRNHPKYFDSLANTLVRYEFKGKNLAQIMDRTIFSVNSKGEMKRICYNYKVGGYMLYSEDLEKMNLFYSAKKEFLSYLFDEKNMKFHEMEEGDVYVFNNWRLLHGRTEFPQGGKRALHGCYLESNVIRSRYLALFNQGFRLN